MKKVYLYMATGLILFVIGSLTSQNWVAILYLGAVIFIYTYAVIILLRKLDFLLKQNEMNIERFEVSLKHSSNVLFDNVLEADITKDCLIGENAEKLTELLNIPKTSSYSKTIYEISTKLVRSDFSEDYRKALSVSNILKTLNEGKNTIEFECVERSDGKNYAWIRVHYCIYRSKSSDCVRVISYVKNIQNEKSAYERLMANARTDQMTGFLNKVSTKEVITDLLIKNENQSYTILMIDIDNFKNINDTYGHISGDEVIISVCKIIKRNFRDTDIIGRIGGDEFLVCLPEKFDNKSIEIKLNKLLEDVQELSTEYSKQVMKGITVSIGVVNTFGNNNFDQLYHYADVAMYEAKEKGKNQYCVYDYTAYKT